MRSQGNSKANIQDNFFFQRKEKGAALGGIQTHDTLLSRAQYMYNGTLAIETS